MASAEESVEFAEVMFPRLRRTAFLLCGDWHTAEDLAQTALAKMFVAWREIRRQDGVHAYANRTLVNSYLAHRRLKRTGELALPGRCQNRKRVRPPGSAAKVTITERGSMRYTFHGGGPCDGALNGAVMPDPLSSSSAGQPLSAHAFAIRATAPGSVTGAASPSMTTSASRIDTAIEHRRSRATLRPFRVPAPVAVDHVVQAQGCGRAA